jgi:hypothetical protein
MAETTTMLALVGAELVASRQAAALGAAAVTFSAVMRRQVSLAHATFVRCLQTRAAI